MTLRPFHLAFPVHDLAAARAFYAGVLGCREGRSSDRWIDFNLGGHQIVAHLDEAARPAEASNAVDGHDVPVPHFGVVLTMPEWQALAARVEAAGVAFGIAPQVRFAGQAGEQATMFFRDPSGNALEFKAFADDSQLFATEKHAMSAPIEVDIPHKLGREAAKQRIGSSFGRMAEFVPGGSVTEHRWDGDTLRFTVEGMGQRVGCVLAVAEANVHATFELPALLAMFADPIRAKLQKEAPKLLE